MHRSAPVSVLSFCSTYIFEVADGAELDFCISRMFQLRFLASESNQSLEISRFATVGSGQTEVVILIPSPTPSSCLFFPSIDTHAPFRPVGLHTTFNSTVAGIIIGRKESECGQIGVISMQGTVGCTMDPPADTEYAVDPVGVAMMRPSPCTQVIGWPSQ